MCFVVHAVCLHAASNCITFSSLMTTSSVSEYSFCMLLFTKQIIVVPFNFTTYLKAQLIQHTTLANTASTVANKFETTILIYNAHNYIYTGESHCNSTVIVLLLVLAA